MWIRMSLFPVCCFCVCAFCAQSCSVNLTFYVLNVFCVLCVCVCTTWWRVPSKSLFFVVVVFTVVCSHVSFCFLSVPWIWITWYWTGNSESCNPTFEFRKQTCLLLFYLFLFGKNIFCSLIRHVLYQRLEKRNLTFGSLSLKKEEAEICVSFIRST